MLHNSLKKSLLQVETILAGIAELPALEAHEAYVGKRIGSHVRHVVDHFLALLKLTASDTVDYNLRSRNSPTETDIAYARNQVAGIIDSLESVIFGSREVVCLSEIDISESKTAAFNSTADREALWVLNHTIHHIALIKLIAEQSGLSLSSDLGVAPATASFQRASS
ncbi:MAG: DinB family protein [Verrucomicrobiota bacterium]